MRRDSELICNALCRENGHVYICGNGTMATDIGNTLQEMIQDYLGITKSDACSFIRNLRVSPILYSH